MGIDDREVAGQSCATDVQLPHSLLAVGYVVEVCESLELVDEPVRKAHEDLVEASFDPSLLPEGELTNVERAHEDYHF